MKSIIYQVLPRVWGKGKMSDWDEPAFNYLKSLGVDTVWYTGMPRHACGEEYVKGNPGSPYAIIDWFDVNPYLADNESERMVEFERLVSRTHHAGLKCMTDFIPNHVAKGYSGKIGTYGYCDGDWTDTRKVNYADPSTVPAMVDVLLFWASKGVDGFRCDMVELVPPEAMAEIIRKVRAQYPSMLFVAEAYGRDNYRRYLDEVGFDLLYDKSGCYDILRGILSGSRTCKELTWNWQFLGDRQPRMLNFLENHDEQRIASRWFASDVKRSWAALAFATLFNTAPFMLYAGQELGEKAEEGHEGRTSIFDWCKPESLSALYGYIYKGENPDPYGASILERYRELLTTASSVLFSEGGNWDLCYCNLDTPGFDADRHFAFMRFNDNSAALVFCNFSDMKADLKVRIPIELKKYTSMDYIEVSAESLDYKVITFCNI